MASRLPGFHGLFGSRARTSSSLSSKQAQLSRVDTAEITPAVIEAQEQASYAISKQLSHKFSGGSAGPSTQDKKKKKKKKEKKVKPTEVEVKKKKLTKEQKKQIRKDRTEMKRMGGLLSTFL